MNIYLLTFLGSLSGSLIAMGLGFMSIRLVDKVYYKSTYPYALSSLIIGIICGIFTLILA